MQSGVFKSKISEDLPRARQVLAQALRDLYESIALPDGKRMSHAKVLKTMKAGYHQSSLCRYFNGENVPSEIFVVSFYKLISEHAAVSLPVTCEELQDLRARAEATDGRRREARKTEPSSDNGMSGFLPVPSAEGDRQSNAFTERPAPQAATEAIQLAEAGLHEHALTLLSQLSEHHDANEAAQCVAHFRAEQHDELADTLIRIYGRDHRNSRMPDVVKMSIALRELHHPDDADSLLKLII